MPLHRRKRQGGFATEPTPGTIVTLAASNLATILFDTEVKADIPPTERPAQSSSTNHPSVPGARAATVTLMHHARGSGTATTATTFEPLLLAAGLTPAVGGSSITYTPLTGSTNTVTFAQFQGGRKKLVAGLMFDLTIKCTTGKPIEFQYEGKGVWNGMTNAANLSPTYNDTPKPPVFQGGTFTVGGTALKCSEVTFKLNNTMFLRQDANQGTGTNGTGYVAAWIGTRKTTVTLDPEAETTKDFYDQHLTMTTGALVLVCGSAAGNTIRISVPKLQLNNPPDSGDRNETEIDTLDGLACQNSSAGDDEIAVSFE